MNKKYNFDYTIIGSGPAGSTIATLLAANKKHRVCLVEGQAFGGSNLCTRDIPYLVGQSFAHNFYKLNTSSEIGGQTLHYNFPSISSHQSAVTALLGADDASRFENLGITCIKGYAHFLDGHTIAVGDSEYTSENFILATGATLSTGDIFGLDLIKYLTPSDILRLRRLPKSILVVGGGSTGCEIAEYFAMLGTKVVLIEKSSHLLPKEDPEAGDALQKYFKGELGIMVLTDAKVVALESDTLSKRVIFKSGSEEKAIRIDHIVLATGSTPSTDCGLENAGVRLTKSGAVMANKFFQTTAKNIYAIGDCLGGNHSSTERAEYEATVLADNLSHKAKGFANYDGFIRITNTLPTIACIGATESRLNRHHAKYKTAIIRIKDLPASAIDSLDYGFIKITASRRTGHILGATIMAPGAELIAEEISLAIRHHLTALQLASTPHIANSYNYAVKLAAKKLV